MGGFPSTTKSTRRAGDVRTLSLTLAKGLIRGLIRSPNPSSKVLMYHPFPGVSSQCLSAGTQHALDHRKWAWWWGLASVWEALPCSATPNMNHVGAVDSDVTYTVDWMPAIDRTPRTKICLLIESAHTHSVSRLQR